MDSKLDLIQEAYDKLKVYQGNNSYIIQLKNQVYAYKNGTLNDFQCEFIVNNYNFEPKYIGKVVKISQWWAEKNYQKYGLDFIPKVMEIGYYLGCTNDFYVFYSRFRKSQTNGNLIICSKNAIWTDFTTPDFHDLDVDFDKFDVMSKDGRKLKEHQKEGIKFLLSRKKCILADGMGLGKSTQCVVSALAGGFKKVLIICPASVKPTWKRELALYVPEDEISIIGSVNETLKKSELEAFLGYKEGESGLSKEELLKEAKIKGKWNDKKYTIVNYDVLSDFYQIPKELRVYYETEIDEKGNQRRVKKEREVVSRKQGVIDDAMANSDLYKSQFDLIILDEAHKLSNLSSERYKIISDFVHRSHPEAVYAVTGTPITNNPYNFYNILKIIDSPVASDWQNYVIRYCEGKKIFVKGQRDKWTNVYLKSVGKNSWYDLTQSQKDTLKVFLEKNAKQIWLHNGASNLDELRERVKTCYLRREQQDMNEVVKKTINVLTYDLPDDDRVEYEEIYKNFKTKNGESNFMIEGVEMRQWLAMKMIPYTQKIVDKHLANGEKVIIFCAYDNEFYALKEIYDDCCVAFNGKTNPKLKVKYEEEFMTNPDCKVFLGNIASASVGLTLTAANICIFNNFSWQSGENDQAEDRVWRLNQKRDCEIYYQLFKDTYLEKMFNKVVAKDNIIKQIIIKEGQK